MFWKNRFDSNLSKRRVFNLDRGEKKNGYGTSNRQGKGKGM